MATFSIACLANETDAILHRFIAHYLRAGAAEVALFIDRAAGETPVSLAPFDAQQQKRIKLTYCDDAFWDALGQRRPDVLEVRQRTVFTNHFRNCAHDWMLACDADEYLVSTEPLSEVLDLTPDDVPSITFFTIEAVWGPGEAIDDAFGNTWFRIPFPTPKAWQRARTSIYGLSGYLMSSRGLVGHHVGKSITRTNSSVDEIQLHWANVDGACVSVSARRLGDPFTSVRLAHFDAIDFKRWRKKFQRRGGRKGASGGRGSRRRVLQRRIANLANRFGSATGRMVFRRFYCLTNRQLEQLKEQDQVCQLRIFDETPRTSA